jgi:hypothetical protein
MAHFIIKQKSNLDEMQIGDKVPESDFSIMTPKGVFVQLQHIEEEENETPCADKDKECTRRWIDSISDCC